jgi:hypothetical protein
MRIETHVDLHSAWNCATVLGKIFFVPLIAVAFIAVLIISIYTSVVAEFGSWAGFFIFDDESEEDETTDRSDSEMGEE